MSATSSDVVVQSEVQDVYVGHFGVIAFVILAIFAATATVALPAQQTQPEQGQVALELAP
jgi:hypothetical protein